MQANAIWGSWETEGRHPFPVLPPTRASGERSKTDTLPEHRSSTTFWRWAFDWLVWRQAPFKPRGRPVIWKNSVTVSGSSMTAKLKSTNCIFCIAVRIQHCYTSRHELIRVDSYGSFRQLSLLIDFHRLWPNEKKLSSIFVRNLNTFKVNESEWEFMRVSGQKKGRVGQGRVQ